MSHRLLISMAVAAALVVGIRPAAAQDAPVRVGGDIKEPHRLVDVKPEYPEIAQRAGIQGIVILEVVIGKDGRVEQSRVLRPVPMLDQAALDAVNQWQYTPTLLNGQPVPVVMTVTVSFAMDRNQTGAPAQEPDVAAILDSAKAMHQRGLYAEAEQMLQRAIAALRAERQRAESVAPASAPATAPVRVGGAIKEPVLVKRVEPVYPAGTPAGASIAEVVVGVDGRISEVRILRSLNAQADAAVVAALRQWVYQPTLLNGVAVPVVMSVTIR